MKVMLVSVAFLLWLPTAGAYAQATGQTRDRATPPPAGAAANANAATLARGWSALEAGQFDNAVRAADAILRLRPWDRAALTLRITALSASSPLNGLDAYEQWIAAKHKEDAGLLEPVAIAVLQEAAKGSDSGPQIAALSALVAARVPGAQEAMNEALASHPQSHVDYAADADAARRGDGGAALRLNAAAKNPADASVDLVAALQGIGSAGQAGLMMLANGGTPRVRAAAIRALGNANAESARPLLQSFFDGMDPATRVPATIALAEMGDQNALARVDQMLATNVPQVQIEASEAWGGRPGPWVEVVRPLLDNTDGFVRLDAARAIAPVDPEAAKRTLGSALADTNPVIRSESARSIAALLDTQPDVADLPALRQRLRDSDRGVRVAVANALLKLARF